MGATLDQRLSMVHFAGDGVGGAGSGDDAFDLARTSGEFQSAMGQLMAMAERVASLDASVSANAQYLSKTTSDCPRYGRLRSRSRGVCCVCARKRVCDARKGANRTACVCV